MKPKVLVLSGYGINCDEETKYAFDISGAMSEIVHINDLIDKKKKLSDYDILAFPGGFSYGDDTGSGNALANKIRNHLWKELEEFVKNDKLVIGICNGFQVLVNLGLLPALNNSYGRREVALLHNDSARYYTRWVDLEVKNKSPWLKEIKTLSLPIAHGEGKFYADKEIIEQLKNKGLIALKYYSGEICNYQGMEANPNGAMEDIAGITDESGRVLGLMPHPERAIDFTQIPNWNIIAEKCKRNKEKIPNVGPGLAIFKNAVDYINNRNFPKKESKEKTLFETTYKIAGVNIELGDDVSKILYNAAKKTWDNRKGNLGEIITPFDDFTGVRAIDVSALPHGTLMNINFDGVGTKIELAERTKNHETVAFDLFAMVCDDAVIRGAEPVIIGSIFDVKSLSKDDKNFLSEINAVARGYINAAKEANVAIVNGEVAELGSRVGGFGDFNYNWGAAVVWFAKKDRMFTGREIKEGDFLVALREEGFRSNGLSLLRKIMINNYGEEWHKKKFLGTDKLMVDLALIPSRIYSKAVVDMFGGYNGVPKAVIHGAAHITGGGVPGKLGRILKPSGLGAFINDPFTPSELMLHLQEIGNVSDKTAYQTWNMGQGMIIITPEPEKVMSVAKEHKIESKIIGFVTKERGIKIMSKGKNKEELFFE